MDAATNTIITVIVVIVIAIILIYMVMSFANRAPAPTTTVPGGQPGMSAVMIKNNSFDPADLQVAKGTTVVWTNQDTSDHSVSSDKFSSQTLRPGDTFQYTFNDPGTYDYNCGIHPQMKGKITVTQ